MSLRPALLRLLGGWLTIALLGCGGTSSPSAQAPTLPAAPETAAPETAAPETATPETAAPAVAPTMAEQVAARLGHGLDVSAHSGTVDWQQVAQGDFTFAFVKATEGVDLADSAFAGHWPAIKAAGLVRGAYHFYVTEDDPSEQAGFFIRTVTLEPGDLAPVVDIELIGHGTEPGLAERLQTFLDLLEQHYGIAPIVYTSPNFWDENLTDGFGGYPLWIAEYGVETPRLPGGWQDWTLWQWQDDASVAGVEKGADLNRANETQDLTRLVLP